MSIFNCVLALFVLSASTAALTPARLSCYQSVTSGLTLSSLFSMCADPSSCESVTSRIAASLQSCARPSPALATLPFITDVQSLCYGVFVGFQANPSVPSMCATSFSSGQQYWDLIVLTVTNMLSGDGALPDVFNVLALLDQFLTQTISSVERCNLETLRKHLDDLAKVEGVFKAMYVIGLNIDPIAVILIQTNFWNFLSDFSLGNFESAGISLGKILSVVLNYQI